MAALRRVLSPSVSNVHLAHEKSSPVQSRQHLSGQHIVSQHDHKPTVSQKSTQMNVLKSLSELEEFLDSMYAQSHSTESHDQGELFWQEIRQTMLQIVELTCQTCQFQQCCKAGLTGDNSCCPFVFRSASMPSLPTRLSPVNIRRGSSPLVSSRSAVGQKEFLVSYGGFESIMNRSDFTVEDGGDHPDSQNETQNMFRRDLRVPPVVRRKKHQSSPSIGERHLSLLDIRERYI